MEKVMIIITGMPGTGKTKLANYVSDTLQIPLICKDKLKEIVWDKLNYDTAESKKYSDLAYDLSFHFCEEIMKSGQKIIIESNFGNTCPSILKALIDKYKYKVITVLLDGDVAVIHKRFIEREATEERHAGLISNGRYNSLEVFKNATKACRSFDYGDYKITVDTTSFSNVDYDAITAKIIKGLSLLNQ